MNSCYCFVCYCFVCYLKQASPVAPIPPSVTPFRSMIYSLLKSLGSLFSIPFLCFQRLAASLCRIPGVGYTSFRTKRFAGFDKTIDLLLLCFQTLANPFPGNPFVCTSIQNPGGLCVSFRSLCPVANLPRNFLFTQARGIVLTSQGDFLNVSE
jgi:hypothetical protein